VADNTTLAAATGGDVIRDKDRATVKTQIVGLDLNIGGAGEVLDTAAALADALANPTTALRAALLLGYNGATWDRLRSTLTGVLRTVDDELRATTLWVTATGTSGAAVTLTLPAAGAGLFHYVTAIDIQLYATAARTGAATPVTVTTTNLPGSPAWHFPTAQAIGAIDRYDVPLASPIKSSAANTATTIVCPVATSGLWRVNVGYYTGT